MNNKFFAASACFILFASCNEEKNEDLTQSVNKNGSVETSVSVNQMDSLRDLLITRHTVKKNGTAFKTYENKDTIPAFVTEKTETALTNRKKKEYEIYITVK